ncbi:MAG: hypothetical protein V2A74_14715, partial [bacterium]
LNAPTQPHLLYVAVNADQRPHRLGIPLLNPEERDYVDVLNSASLAVVTHSDDAASSASRPRLVWKSAPESVGIYYENQLFVDIPPRSAVYLIPRAEAESWDLQSGIRSAQEVREKP